MIRGHQGGARRTPSRLLLLMTILWPLLIGCSNRPRTYPVSGKVQFENGNPVVVGIVEFQSVQLALNARGEIQPDGTFELTTFEQGDGAVAGRHKCVVLQMVMGENIVGHKPSTIGVVDPKFASYASSGLEFEVQTDSANELVVKVHGIQKQPFPGEEHEH